jgi:hypothetical protein
MECPVSGQGQVDVFDEADLQALLEAAEALMQRSLEAIDRVPEARAQVEADEERFLGRLQADRERALQESAERAEYESPFDLVFDRMTAEGTKTDFAIHVPAGIAEKLC